MSTSKKTKELIIYIASKLKEKPNYGSTLLNKALYLIDSMSYLKKGSPISDLSYIRQDHGPTPKPSEFLSVRDELEVKGYLVKNEVEYYGRRQIKYVSTRDANINVFEKDELVLIDDILEGLSGVNATAISDYTHELIAWQFAQPKEELPFYTFLLTNKEPDLKDMVWARGAIKKYEAKHKGN